MAPKRRSKAAKIEEDPILSQISLSTDATKAETTAAITSISKHVREGGKKDKRQVCSGHVESIELTDFMCHRHLLINFNAHINFVVGNNGSGKSAILTALTVALGGRASATQRASSVDSLIREGAQSGKVRVKLFNGGDNPYQPDIYDGHIIIERSFKREGTNAYSIYSEGGRMISGRRDEIDAICDHFGLQVDNPLAILTQETAKKFLANAKPRELYEFFMKATQLEQLSIDYSFTMDRIEESKARLEQSKSALDPLKANINQLEKQLSDLEKFKLTHKRIQELRGELTWAMIIQREKEYEHLCSSLGMKKEKVDGLEEKIYDTQSNLDKLLRHLAEIEQSIVTDQGQLDTLIRSRNVFVNQLRGLEQNLGDLKKEALSINTEFMSFKSQLEELNQRIALDDDAINGGDRSTNLRKLISDLETELVELNAKTDRGKEFENTSTGKIDELVSRLRVIESKKDGIQRQIDHHKTSLYSAEKCKDDRVGMFGEKMSEVLAKIRRDASLFSHPPVGPAGLYIKLKDKRWTRAVEAILHSNVEAFLVNDHRDRGKLQQILKQFGLTNPIVVVKFKGDLDISEGTPDPNLLTALNVLEIDSSVVRKMLIILCQLESNVLVEDRHEALRLVQQRRKNVNAVYTCTARMHANSKTVSVNQLFTSDRLSRLADDMKGRINEMKRRITDLTTQLQVVQRDWTASEIDLQKAKAEQQGVLEETEKTDRRLRSIRMEIRQARDELAEFNNDVPVTLFIEQEKTRIEERLDTLSHQFSANSIEQQRLQSELVKANEELMSADEKVSAVRGEHKKSVETISAIVNSRRGIERELELLARQKNSEIGLVAQLTAGCEVFEKEMTVMRAAALNVCPRVETHRSVPELDRELSAQEECLHVHENAQLDPIKLKENLTTKRIQYREVEKSIVINERLVKTLADALEQRQHAWIEFRKSVSKMSSTEFIFMLQARGFQGSLDYRHNDEELHVKVIPQGQQQYQATSASSTTKRQRVDSSSSSKDACIESHDIKQLSGGEKSYSTACFLFSLWQAMGSPLRCLDEFDVYMDPINRTFILELLVSHARASQVQFILITPNAIPDSYKTAPDVSIYRLRDPERTQSTLSAIKLN